MSWFLLIAAAALTALVIANGVARRIFRYAENLKSVDPVVREVFWSQHIFLEVVLVGMAALCVVFPVELSGTPLGRALSGFLAAFWGVRLAMQFFHYSAEARDRFRGWDWVFSATFVYLTALFGALAMGVGA